MTTAATTTDHGKNMFMTAAAVLQAPVTGEPGPHLHSARWLRGAGYHCLSPGEETKAEVGRPPKVTWRTAKSGFF